MLREESLMITQRHMPQSIYSNFTQLKTDFYIHCLKTQCLFFTLSNKKSDRTSPALGHLGKPKLYLFEKC